MKRGEVFPEHKVLEVLLYYSNPRGDTNPTAHLLLDRFGSVAGILDARPDELKKVPGVGEHTVVLLKAAKETARRYFTARTELGEIIYSPEDAYPILRPHFFGARNERVFVMVLDGKRKNLGVRQIGEGDADLADLTPRKVAEPVLALNGTQVILAHNHPSGVAVPSDADVSTTERVQSALAALGIELYDHVIFSDDDMVSMRESLYFG